MTESTISVQDEAFALAAVGRVLLVLWRGAPTTARLELLAGMTERMIAAHPDGFFELQVIEPSSPPPDSKVRQGSAAVLRRMGGVARGIAFVVEGDSVRSGIVRTILRALSLLSRSAVPQRFYAELPRALEWAEQELRLSEAELACIRQTLARMREDVPESPLSRSA